MKKISLTREIIRALRKLEQKQHVAKKEREPSWRESYEPDVEPTGRVCLCGHDSSEHSIKRKRCLQFPCKCPRYRAARGKAKTPTPPTPSAYAGSIGQMGIRKITL